MNVANRAILFIVIRIVGAKVRLEWVEKPMKNEEIKTDNIATPLRSSSMREARSVSRQRREIGVTLQLIIKF